LDGQQAKLCVSRIAREVLAVRPLADALKQPIRVLPMNDEGALSLPSGHAGRIEAVINDVAVRIGAPRFKIVSDAGDQSVFESVISNRLALGPDVIVDGDFGRAVVLVSACGMPAKLCERWMRFLGENHFVITWESRLLFEDLTAGQEWAYDVDAHVADLFAVMDHFGVQQAHLMGLCGGAVVAVAAAAKRRDRVRSLSLWHGDYELGSACPKTKHQKDLQALMAVVASSQLQADQIHQMFSHNILKNFRKDLAHIVLYPYANSQLLHRYGRSNGNIMQTNVSSLLSQVRQPSLVVTSDDDNTAHPAGSMFVAERLANAQLQMERHGDHLSLFDARSHVTEAASRFLETVGY
jgi:pimeloyl-ACP methyl ester carboxylesterase